MTYYNRTSRSVEHYLYGSLSIEELYSIHPIISEFYECAKERRGIDVESTISNLRSFKKTRMPKKDVHRVFGKAAFVYFLYEHFTKNGDEYLIQKFAKDKETIFGYRYSARFSALCGKLQNIEMTMKTVLILGIVDPLHFDPFLFYRLFLGLISQSNRTNEKMMEHFGYDPQPFNDNVTITRHLHNPFPGNRVFRVHHAIQTSHLLNVDLSEKFGEIKVQNRIRNIRVVLYYFFALGYDPYVNELYCRCAYHHQHSYPQGYKNKKTSVPFEEPIISKFVRPPFCNVYCVVWRIMVNLHADYQRHITLYRLLELQQ